MKKLKLPVIRQPFPEASQLSMDEYFRMVQANCRIFGGKASEEWEIKGRVNVRFVLKKIT